jgi:hypothetical protein
MTMSMTRSRFCSALMSASALWILPGCGGGGTDYGGSPAPSPSPGPAPGPAPAPQCGANGAAIVGNHGHVLVFDRADLDAMSPPTYHIQGSATHDHTVTFSIAQLQTLKAGGSVTVTSSFNGHDHQVTATCL